MLSDEDDDDNGQKPMTICVRCAITERYKGYRDLATIRRYMKMPGRVWCNEFWISRLPIESSDLIKFDICYKCTNFMAEKYGNLCFEAMTMM